MVHIKMETADPALATPSHVGATPWHIGRGWSDSDIQTELASLASRPISYPIDAVDAERDPGWTVERFLVALGHEPPGPPLPDGFFSRVRAGIIGYRFAHPALTEGHFYRDAPLLGRDMLILIRAVFIRLLVGLRIGAVRDEATATETRFGVRMDTIAGHIFHGSEWVLVVKDHQTGSISMEMDVQWKPAQMPTWWMALGFRLFGRQIQERWRNLAARRLQRLGQRGNLQ